MKTLFVSDLDGTLLGPDRKVSAESVRLINEAITDGAMFSVATARTPATVGPLLSAVESPLPFIVMTGAAIWDRERNRYVYASFHREETARRLVDLYRSHGLSSFVYILGHDNVIHIYHIGEMSRLEREFMEERLHTPYKDFHILDKEEGKLPESLDRVLLFYSMRPTDEVRCVYEEIKDSDDLRAVFYHDMYGEDIALMEVFGPEASKANAVRRLAGMVGADRIVAYGDNVNDIPILEVADDAVVVENAVEAARLAAERVIGPNSEDSVAKDIKKQTKMLKNLE
ncbi:MAG: Cof-type HAD-IIB family hydrolase [Muribaculaceae bacterium]|nr:Cof-type HAD-IIB family hydrolase [Muribaculaceae bacterium]